jgi:predicted small lipoprotein YifL
MLREFAAEFRSARSVATVTLLAVALAGCGIKGPLKLPAAQPASTAPAAENPPAPAPPLPAPAASDAGGSGRKP